MWKPSLLRFDRKNYINSKTTPNLFKNAFNIYFIIFLFGVTKSGIDITTYPIHDDVIFFLRESEIHDIYKTFEDKDIQHIKSVLGVLGFFLRYKIIDTTESIEIYEMYNIMILNL